MQIVLFADRAGRALAPFTNRTCAALLPIAGKPLIEHALESVARLSPDHVFVVVSPHADLIESELEDGRRWGLPLEYVLTRGSETPDATLERLRPRLTGDFLIVRGDVLLATKLPAFLERASARSEPSIAGAIGDQPTGLRFVRDGAEGILHLPIDPESRQTWSENAPGIELRNSYFSRIEDLAALHRANLDAASGTIEDLILPGRAIQPGVVVGRQSRVPTECLQGAPVFIGSRCDVKATAEIHGDVVLCDDVVVDRQATVRNAVVLPNTYVGEMVDVSDAIVWSNDLVHIDTGAVARVTDEFLLADLGAPGLEEGFVDGLHRVLGGVLFALSLPLWPILLLASVLVNPRAPLRRIQLVGNRKSIGRGGQWVRSNFETWEAATRIPVLRHLPLLLSVVRGDLRMVGVSPLTPEEADARTEEWERLRDRAPAGLVGPAQLNLPEDAPAEERFVLEAYYAQTRSAGSDLVWLARGVGALFTPRAWGPGLRPRTS